MLCFHKNKLNNFCCFLNTIYLTPVIQFFSESRIYCEEPAIAIKYVIYFKCYGAPLPLQNGLCYMSLRTSHRKTAPKSVCSGCVGAVIIELEA